MTKRGIRRRHDPVFGKSLLANREVEDDEDSKADVINKESTIKFDKASMIVKTVIRDVH